MSPPINARILESSMSMAKLGDKVKEVVSGLEGIVTCESLSLSGCRQILIVPQEVKDGKPVDGSWYDDSRCTVLQTGVVPVSPRFAKAEGGAWHGSRPSAN